jgi:DNA repair exonuclease SbcCD ATPase subunit
MGKVNAAVVMVLGYQQEVKEAEEHVVALKAAITEQRERVQKANSFTTNVPELLTQRENLLADIVLNKRSNKELEELDAVIAGAQKELDENTANAGRVVPDAKAAIAGLERRLAEAEESLARLKEKKPEELWAFLLSEAERIGGEYSEACKVVAAKHRQLLAIDGIIKRITNYARNKTILTNWGVDLELPLFRLDACKGLAGNCQPGYEARVKEAELTKNDRRVMAAAEEQERARIAAMGIEL